MTEDDKTLVDRLRWVSEWYFVDPVDGAAYASDDPLDAADRIEALSAENERLIEQHEAFRQEVSDAVKDYVGYVSPDRPAHPITRFIITKPDPLVEVLADMGLKPKGGYDWASEFRATLAARGLEIREKEK